MAERELLERVLEEATGFLDGLDDRRIASAADVDDVADVLGGPLSERGTDAVSVIEELIAGAEPGLVAMPSGRFFGWVIGGVLPAALAADWLTSVWDQNAGLLVSSPAAAGAERVAGDWLLDLLGLPGASAVGFVTGGMMANFTCLAAARHVVLRRAGWDVDADGLQDAPKVTVVVGAERHESIDLSLRFLGLGPARSRQVAVDDEGRIRLDRWELNDDVQSAVRDRWESATQDNITQVADTAWFLAEVRRLYGFDVPTTNYESPTEVDTPWP